jgi:cysteine desulfurase
MSGNMQPSHVLAAMGLPVTGNMRITLHPQTTHEDVAKLLLNLEELVRKQRDIN